MNIGQKVITSMEVAEMMEVRHSDILAKLEGNSKVKGIIPVMTERNIPSSDYFTESTYTDVSGKENKCYLITKLGCDFLANKFTGEKGILFTAKYVKRFREMEEEIVKPKSPIQILELELAAIKEIDSKVDLLNDDLQAFKKDMPLLGLECDKITLAVKAKGINCLGGKETNAYQDKSLRGRVYADMYGQLKREFAVGTYKALKRSQTELAISIIKEYKLPLALQEEITNANNQINL